MNRQRPIEWLQARLTFTQHGKVLSRINGPIAYPAGISPIDYRRECLVTPLGRTCSECGWAIQFHENTLVALECTICPIPNNNLTLRRKSLQAVNPASQAADWVSAPIDPEKLALVGAPV